MIHSVSRQCSTVHIQYCTVNQGHEYKRIKKNWKKCLQVEHLEENLHHTPKVSIFLLSVQVSPFHRRVRDTTWSLLLGALKALRLCPTAMKRCALEWGPCHRSLLTSAYRDLESALSGGLHSSVTVFFAHFVWTCLPTDFAFTWPLRRVYGCFSSSLKRCRSLPWILIRKIYVRRDICQCFHYTTSRICIQTDTSSFFHATPTVASQLLSNLVSQWVTTPSCLQMWPSPRFA